MSEKTNDITPRIETGPDPTVKDNLSSVSVFDPGARPFPLTLTTRNVIGEVIADVVVSPPDPHGGDRTEEDRKRHRDRIRDQVRPKLPEIIGGNPIFGDKGKIKVPVSGGYEPRWRYGRDPQGGGGGSGPQAGTDPADEIYVEFDLDEILEMLFQEMELPDMLKKQLATTKVKAFKFRGIQPTGPKPRLRKGDTARARIRRAIGMRNANPDDPKYAALIEEESKKKKIPTPSDVPFHRQDFRYNRVEETLDDESKAVVFFVLDRSGSMGGEPLMIAKAFFVLNLLFLRNKYKEVKVVMIGHDAHAFRVEDETKFFQIEAGGGTVAEPAYQMVYDIAQAEFPASTWNRYLFQATDGMLFDGDDVIRGWYTKLIKTDFNYAGYLEVGGSSWGWGGGGWQSGGQALLGLPEEIKKHVGMGKADSLKDVPDAFKQILDKDKKKA